MAAAALEQSMLESKDKDTLLEMAKALGVKANGRLKKADIIDRILDTTGSSAPSSDGKACTSIVALIVDGELDSRSIDTPCAANRWASHIGVTKPLVF